MCTKHRGKSGDEAEEILVNATINPEGTNAKFVVTKLTWAADKVGQTPHSFGYKYACYHFARAFKHCHINKINTEIRKRMLTVDTNGNVTYNTHQITQIVARDFLDETQDQGDRDTQGNVRWDLRWKAFKIHGTALVDNLCVTVPQIETDWHKYAPVFIPGWTKCDPTGQAIDNQWGPSPPTHPSYTKPPPQQYTTSYLTNPSPRPYSPHRNFTPSRPTSPYRNYTPSYPTSPYRHNTPNRPTSPYRQGVSFQTTNPYRQDRSYSPAARNPPSTSTPSNNLGFNRNRTTPPTMDKMVQWYKSQKKLCLTCGSWKGAQGQYHDDWLRCKARLKHFPSFVPDINRIKDLAGVSRPNPPQSPAPPPPPLGSRYAHRDTRGRSQERDSRDRERSRSRDRPAASGASGLSEPAPHPASQPTRSGNA